MFFLYVYKNVKTGALLFTNFIHSSKKYVEVQYKALRAS